MHVEGVVLNGGDPFGQPFIFVLNSVYHHLSLSLSLSVFPKLVWKVRSDEAMNVM